MPLRNPPLDRVFASQEKHTVKSWFPPKPAESHQIPPYSAKSRHPNPRRDCSFARGAYRQIPSSTPLEGSVRFLEIHKREGIWTHRGFAKGVAGTVSLPIFSVFFFRFLPFSSVFSVFPLFSFCFLPFFPFSSVSFRFFPFFFRFFPFFFRFFPFFSFLLFFRVPIFSVFFRFFPFFPFFSVFFRFLPFFSVSFRFFPFSYVFFRFLPFFSVSFSEKNGETPFARPLLRNPELSPLLLTPFWAPPRFSRIVSGFLN